MTAETLNNHILDIVLIQTLLKNFANLHKMFGKLAL
jgi:hypothetical protein